jgi:hypothetical protein
MWIILVPDYYRHPSPKFDWQAQRKRRASVSRVTDTSASRPCCRGSRRQHASILQIKAAN